MVELAIQVKVTAGQMTPLLAAKAIRRTNIALFCIVSLLVSVLIAEASCYYQQINQELSDKME